MINLLSESAYIAQTNKIKTAIRNKVNAIKASFTRIGAKLGATINWLDDVETALNDDLTAINTELVAKGSTQADDFSDVAEKISDIQTGIPPTGQIAITQNGNYDVTNYASASVAVPTVATELFTAQETYSNALSCKNLLSPYVEENNAYTVFSSDLKNATINQMCMIVFSKINNSVWCNCGTRYSSNTGRISNVNDMNSGNTSAYAMIINEGDKIFKTVIPLANMTTEGAEE